jgi:glycosyltransferase involved in cell wall biosynthesis
MITIYTITYQEEHIIEYFVKWYRDRFKDCTIVVFDNESTDNTRQIATDLGCEVITYCTGNKLSDSTYLQIKNNIWKQAETDWVIVCDVDEFLDVDESYLNTNQTLYKAKGYNMCNVDNLADITEIKHGVEAIQYDKTILFNKKYINEINYGAGCHYCQPKGNIIYSGVNPSLYHMKFINVDLIVHKYKTYAERLSDENKAMRWGYHYEQDEYFIREEFKNTLQIATKIR